jgi:hypothetical protein
VPGQARDRFRAWIDSVRRADPALLAAADNVLLNTSTDASSCGDEYDALCAEHGFTQLEARNVGLGEGRRRCMRHFYETTEHGTMVCFDDGMRLHTAPGLCRNGLSAFLPRLLATSLEILRNEPALDFLTLSFAGLDGDPGERQARDDENPDVWGLHMPGRDAPRVGTIKSHAGVSYIAGGVSGANVPALLTRRAARTILLGHGRLDGGVLLSLPR